MFYVVLIWFVLQYFVVTNMTIKWPMARPLQLRGCDLRRQAPQDAMHREWAEATKCKIRGQRDNVHTGNVVVHGWPKSSAYATLVNLWLFHCEQPNDFPRTSVLCTQTGSAQQRKRQRCQGNLQMPVCQVRNKLQQELFTVAKLSSGACFASSTALCMSPGEQWWHGAED